MPFYVHSKDVTEPWALPDDQWETRPTRAEAFELAQSKGHIVTFHATEPERYTWHRREERRFTDGTYIDVPWNVTGDMVDHYAHISLEHEGEIAYTPDDEHGVTARKVHMTPGRYLAKFYREVFSADQIARYVEKVKASFTSLHIATSPAEIVRVYLGGPSSCMDGEHFNESMEVETHPCSVYGAPGDLALAYTGHTDNASQRAVIWPKRQIWARIYGTGPLEHLLTKEGYRRGSLRGARILAIPHSGGYLMPYLDGCEKAAVSVLDSRFIKLGDGPLATQTQSGWTEDKTNYASCDRCGEEYDADEDGGDGYCQQCYDDRYVCDHCDDTFWEGGGHAGDEFWCNDCIDENTTECADEHCGRAWIDIVEFSAAEREERKAHDKADLCRACADRYLYCERCDSAYDTDDKLCPHCQHSARCQETGDLLGACGRCAIHAQKVARAATQTVPNGENETVF